jgi:hypothetical protein
VLFKQCPSGQLLAKDFEAYRGSVEVLSVWVFRLLDSVLEPLPPLMYEMEKRFSASVETDELVRR